MDFVPMPRPVAERPALRESKLQSWLLRTISL